MKKWQLEGPGFEPLTRDIGIQRHGRTGRKQMVGFQWVSRLKLPFVQVAR
jgi:hypothetical protein